MPTSFRLYNTLKRDCAPFEPLVDGEISLYVCGMTVYDHIHVGHARAMVVFDTFVRWLRHGGWKVRFVRNFTDVDDKIIQRAEQRGIEPMALAEEFIAAFHEDVGALGLASPDVEPRVSTTMDEIRDMVAALIERGHAYEAGGSVWFDVGTYSDYGALSGQKPEDVQCSADVGHKRNARDFALWKAAKPGEPTWDSPWGPGRPGWHIECSAMAAAHLGETIDIHGGGLDLVFPHHENEIAQSCCAHHAPYVRNWMHNGLLTMVRKTEAGHVSDAKMGKSLGNVVNVRDALREFPAEALRLYYLQSHYRSPLPWTSDALPEALAMLARLYEAREVGEAMGGSEPAEQVAEALGADATLVLEIARSFNQRFDEAMADDFNTAKALGLAFELARALNRMANHKKAKKRGGPIATEALKALSRLHVIGLLTDSCAAFQEQVKDKRLGAMGVDRAQVEALIAERAQARADKNWARADEIRTEIDRLGILVMDLADGVDWRVKLVLDD